MRALESLIQFAKKDFTAACRQQQLHTIMGKRRRKNRELIVTLAEKYRESEKPLCPHYGSCGGCLFQDISYENQLQLKKEYLNTITGSELPDIDAVNPAQNRYGYRNRMDYVSAFGSNGLRKRGSFKEVIDITDCPLLQKKSHRIWTTIREHLADIEGYDYLKHSGFLRYCVLREAYYTGETMLNFVVAADSHIDTLQKIIDDLGDLVTSSSVLLNDTMTDLSYAPVLHILKQGFISEEFEGISFRIHPNTFFQSNSEVALRMYQRIREHVHGKVLDLYCGVGSISLFTASNAESVHGVELVADSITSAKENAVRNSITNTTFTEYDARFFLKFNEQQYNTLILDPPRAGMNPKMYKYFHNFQPETIVYMSCNPATFINDYTFLKEYYELESFEAYDMFPQTPHLESLAVLQKRGT